MRKKFVWEPWEDPIDPADPFAVNSASQPWDDDYEEMEAKKSFPMAHTPFGFLPITENNKASNRFDFWVLHTNFDLTEDITDIVDSIPGVETAEVFTRYRMRIGFPRSGLFNVGEVKKQIQDAIIEADQRQYVAQLMLFDAEIIHKALATCKDLSRTADYWGIYVVPNGNMSIVKAQEQSDYPQFKEQLRVFKTAQQLVGGQVLSSE